MHVLIADVDERIRPHILEQLKKQEPVEGKVSVVIAEQKITEEPKLPPAIKDIPEIMELNQLIAAKKSEKPIHAEKVNVAPEPEANKTPTVTFEVTAPNQENLLQLATAEVDQPELIIPEVDYSIQLEDQVTSEFPQSEESFEEITTKTEEEPEGETEEAFELAQVDELAPEEVIEQTESLEPQELTELLEEEPWFEALQFELQKPEDNNLNSELATYLKPLEPKEAEAIKDVVDEIVETVHQIHEFHKITDEQSLPPEELETLQELCIQLFDHLDIKYDEETLKWFVQNLVQTEEPLEDTIKTMYALEEGTHEQKTGKFHLLSVLNQLIKQKAASFSLIGRLALQVKLPATF